MQTENILISAGLSVEQSAIYEALLERGPQKASDLAKWSGIGRSLVYKVLEQLDSIGLVSKQGGSGTVAVYTPNHPSLLLDHMDKVERELELARESVSANLGSFLSKFNLINEKPSVQFYEGVKGLERLWSDIITEKTNILLIQSPDDRKLSELEIKINNQIKKQVTNNISTRAITPLVSDTKEFIEKYDTHNLVTRSIIDKEIFNIPAQVIVYGENKVGITSFGEHMITTIIEDTAIHKTFSIMFEYIWDKNKKDNEAILKTLDIKI